jgi:predicted anti-sigma-YlaC factor YlaD
MNVLYSCQKVAELLSQAMDEPLTLTDRVRLQVHLTLCGNCRNVEEQLTMLRGLGASLDLPSDDDPTP